MKYLRFVHELNFKVFISLVLGLGLGSHPAFAQATVKPVIGLGHSPVIIAIHDVVKTEVEETTDIDVTQSRLTELFTYLKAQNYVSLSLEDLYRAKLSHRKLPLKSFILTLDDGYMGEYLNAFPLLKKFGFKADYFVITSMVGSAGGRGFFDWNKMKEMEATGLVRIYPHTLTHRDLTQITDAELDHELKDSQAAVVSHLGGKRLFFSYPMTAHNPHVVEFTKRYFKMAVIGDDAPNSSEPLYELPRMVVTKYIDSVDTFAGMLKDWLNGIKVRARKK